MSLSNKVDFAVVFRVKNANPNGDPLNGNRPRTTYEGYGEVSDVCIKRKIRNRLMEEGENIFVQSDDNKLDNYTSLKARADGTLKEIKDKDEIVKKACEVWFDVRAFGQVMAYKGKNKGTGVSIPIRGPVSIHSAFSVEPVNVSSIQITKSVSGEGEGTKKGSDTMGMKHRVDSAVYICYGSMSPQLSTKTGFSDEDAAIIKKILPRLFENDASSARPDGSMEVLNVVWWKHNSKNGQVSSAKVHRSMHVEIKSDGTVVLQFDDLDKLSPEVIDGY
ncbi:type I-C CRISPR-associated protein Cas7/Csd2 [Desulfonatronovibrio magnus]|uniref:type I-C CRISPR-associated protein Cas7/Csd2 n=1 Tax=Desulfonatronovibrio magnus TaxID=698827 RepID=UPI0005EB3CF0|nr:type I-C CRISPR-associated protein Cas7/Csd2 [Desulfonatronovibrio magnus]